MTFARTLRELMLKEEMLVAPGVFDGLSAILAKKAGFSVLYASGGAIARSMGYPDIGLVTLPEVLRVLANIVDTSKLPIIADGDTGFGNVLNVRRTIYEYERLGIAGVHLEDQTFPKRCGHLKNKAVITTEEMVAKIIAAREVRKNPDFLLIARTDAISVEGFDSAIKRSKAYLRAGADMIFIEAPETIQQIEEIAKQIPQPKLINMFSGGKTPLVPVAQLKALGYSVVIIPSDLQRAAIMAMQKTLAAILKTGNSASIESSLTSFNERENIIGAEAYLEKDAMIGREAAELMA
jgi:2-methylisocitrate lyase-like PEP mutase family enzyme